MKRIDIKGGYSCTNNCLFCIVGDRRLNQGDRDTKEMFSLLRRSREEGFEKVVLTGGEITMRKDLLVLIRYAWRMGFRDIHIETNGVLLHDDRLVESVVLAGANSFTVSLPAADAELYALLTRTEQSHFCRVIAGLKNIRKRTRRVGVNCTVNKMNADCLESVVRLSQGLGIRSVHFPFINLRGNAEAFIDKVGISLVEGAPSVRKAIALGIRLGMGMTTEMIPPCHLGEWKECSCDSMGSEMRIVGLEYIDTDFFSSKHRFRKKAKCCQECILDSSCPGINDDAYASRNLASLHPVRDDP